MDFRVQYSSQMRPSDGQPVSVEEMTFSAAISREDALVWIAHVREELQRACSFTGTAMCIRDCDYGMFTPEGNALVADALDNLLADVAEIELPHTHDALEEHVDRLIRRVQKHPEGDEVTDSVVRDAIHSALAFALDLRPHPGSYAFEYEPESIQRRRRPKSINETLTGWHLAPLGRSSS